MKKKLKFFLNEQGYDEKQIKLLLILGKVKINNEIEKNGDRKITEEDKIDILNEKKYVSRGAYKLLEAKEKFNFNFLNKIVLDIGSSTGGFVQVAIEAGAKLVYALDVGTNQLDYSLRINEKVISLEKTNLKTISPSFFEKKIDIVTCDVSFISLKHVFNVLTSFFNLEIIVLIKPQFEADKIFVKKGGVVDEIYHKEIIDKIITYANNLNFKFKELIKSPIKGLTSKNTEYLAWFQKE